MNTFFSLIDQLNLNPAEKNTLEAEIWQNYGHYKVILALDMSGFSLTVRRDGIVSIKRLDKRMPRGVREDDMRFAVQHDHAFGQRPEDEVVQRALLGDGGCSPSSFDRRADDAGHALQQGQVLIEKQVGRVSAGDR